MDRTLDTRTGRGGVERRRPAVPAALLTAAMGMTLHAAPAAAQDGAGLDEVIGRAAAFVAAYVDELSNVLMEEDYQQTYYEDYGDAPAHSQLVSEFLLTRLDDDGQWVGFRDIVELNGRKLENRGNRLAALFADGGAGAMAQVRRITEESARYNLGATRRTFNVPTYSLFFLHPANVDRFRFERMLTGRAGCAGVETAWDVSFQEVGFPTIARGFQNISLPASGRFCLDPESGRVLETEFGLRHPSIGPVEATDTTARVTFGFEPRLNLWVPLEMRDSVSEEDGGRMVGIARYRNHRQFGVTVSENTDPPPDGNGGPR